MADPITPRVQDVLSPATDAQQVRTEAPKKGRKNQVANLHSPLFVSERDSNFAEIQALQVIVFASFSRTVCLGTSAEIQRKQVRREVFALSRGQRPTEAT